jgi:hypothetical protein
MFSGWFRLKALSAAIALVAGVIAALTPADAGTGRVVLEIGGAGFIVGVSGGSGQLDFNGRAYPLRVRGASVGLTIGVAAQRLSGTAENINRPADIEGRYSQVSASAAFGPGGRVIQMKNARGVVLRLQGVQAGFEASLAVGGLRLSLR